MMGDSPKPRQVGRPKASLSSQVPPVTRRIRRLIDQIHGGNLAAAGRATGIPYPTIRDLYTGRSANPELATLDQLRAAYGVSLNWFTDRAADDEVPLQGRTVLLPPHPRAQQAGTRALRTVLIPYSARALLQVFAVLEEWLRRQPASAERPIVGEAAGDAFTFRLTTFVLQPLLGAEKLGQEVVPSAQPDGAWIARLEALGAMWRSVLPEVFRGT
jgi:transcriptional regulator with XRE-family HTH domain